MTALREKKANVWERDGLDWYQEPVSATSMLLEAERFVGTIWDPACGGGNIIKACVDAGYSAVGTDITKRVNAWWFRGEQDFMAWDDQPLAQNVVMNPPFFRAKGAEAFISKALGLATGKVCAFVDVKFLAGTGRANGLFAEHPPHRIWIITPRPSCPPGEYLAAGNKAGGGTADWCWLVWDQTTPFTGTSLNWLRRAA